MLGETQKEWLIENMQESEVDFLFVVSPSSFFLPHIGPRTEWKDESWTVYINERDELMGQDQDNRPTNGKFTYNDQTVDIHWSSFYLDDVPRKFRQKPIYSVVQVNNVFENSTGEENSRFVAYERPQVIVKYYDGQTGELLYAKSIRAN